MAAVAARYAIHTDPVAAPRAVVVEKDARFTMLTSRCVRMEYCPGGEFEDRPSQAFWFRRQPVPKVTVNWGRGKLTIQTSHLKITYRPEQGGFTADSLQVELVGEKTTWHYGQHDPENLMGTERTLDGVDGAKKLEPGLMSRSGWAVVDDSESLVFDSGGWLSPRSSGTDRVDLYFFGYGTRYQECLRDFCAIAGTIPLIPRWALGNWYSRYWAYTDRELLDLMEEFQSRRIPLSVCVIDMDWHVVKNPHTRGWTGYTWSRKHFPNPRAFLGAMHRDYNLKISLNLHPADGVYPHEKAYPAMARLMGIDPASKKPVSFDIADPKFAKAYFELLHHPHEKTGVDFWWMDYQQRKDCRLEGLDVLWWINHLHWLDSGRSRKQRPFVFSRWAGLGNHRYQIGFSGDTIVSWDSLAHLPYFTATASNVGYSWWSHDIGGHFWGYENPELYARWVQYGVFSPVLRLHSSKNRFQTRRPWEQGITAREVASQALRLRHALIPYIYSMNRLTHTQSVPLVRPMYWTHGNDEQAYHCPNQYWFGTELIAAPYLQPIDPQTGHSRQVVWLPKGDWFDFTDGTWYRGGRWHALYGTIEQTPVFARAGAIVPLDTKTEWNHTGNSPEMELAVLAGADNALELYEDDGRTQEFENGVFAVTRIEQQYSKQRTRLTIHPAKGDLSVVPRKRSWTIRIGGIRQGSRVRVTVGGKPVKVESRYDPKPNTQVVIVPPVAISAKVDVSVSSAKQPLLNRDDRFIARMERVLAGFELHVNAKQRLYQRFVVDREDPAGLEDERIVLSPEQRRCLCELLFGAGYEIFDDCIDEHRRMVLWNNNNRSDVKRYIARGHRFQKESYTVAPFEVVPLQGGNPWRDEPAMPTGSPWRICVAWGHAHESIVEQTGREKPYRVVL